MTIRRCISVLLSIFVVLGAFPARASAQNPVPEKDSPKVPAAIATEQSVKTPAKSPQEQIYERSKAMLDRLKLATDKRKQMVQGFVGKECQHALGDAGCGTGEPGWNWSRVTQAQVDEAFSETYKGFAKQRKDLEDAHNGMLQNKRTPEEFMNDVYRMVANDVHKSYWDGETVWPLLVMQVLRASNDRVEESLDAMRQKAVEDMSSLPSEQRDAALDRLDRAQSAQLKIKFKETAGKFRDYLYVVESDRERIVQELWCWQEFAASLSKLNDKPENPVHANGSRWAREAVDSYDFNHFTRWSILILLDTSKENSKYYDWYRQSMFKDIQGPDGDRVLYPDQMTLRPVRLLLPKNCPDAGPTERLQLHVAHLDIDYRDWFHNRIDLRQAAAASQENMKQAKNALDKREKEYQSALSVHAAQRKELAFQEGQLRAAERQARALSPAGKQKSPAYRKNELLLKQKKTRSETILQRIQQIQAMPKPDFRTVDKLHAEYDQLSKDIATLQTSLKKMQDAMGFSASVDTAKKQLSQLEDDYWDKRKTVEHAAGEFALADTLRIGAEREADQAREQLDAANQALKMFGPDDAPLIKDVVLSPYYHAVYWTPEEGLRTVEENIRFADEQIQFFAERRGRDRSRLADAGENATLKSQSLARWQLASYAGQATVESIFNIRDLLNAKGGLAGAFVEAVKKGIEACLFGGIAAKTTNLKEACSAGAMKLEEPDVNLDWRPEILKSPADLGVTAAKRGGKTIFPGAPAKAIVAKYLASQKKEELEKAWQQMMNDSFNMPGPVTPGTALEKLREEARKLDENYAKAVGKKGFGALAKGLTKSFVLGWGKDLAKQQLKKYVADLFESQAWLECMEADLEARATVRILLYDSNHYWEARDMRQFWLDERAEILAQYDPKNHLRVLESKSFSDAAELALELSESATEMSLSGNRKFVVTLGGKEVKSDGTANTRFTVDAKNLAHSPDGGVALSIKVVQ